MFELVERGQSVRICMCFARVYIFFFCPNALLIETLFGCKKVLPRWFKSPSGFLMRLYAEFLVTIFFASKFCNIYIHGLIARCWSLFYHHSESKCLQTWYIKKIYIAFSARPHNWSYSISPRPSARRWCSKRHWSFSPIQSRRCRAVTTTDHIMITAADNDIVHRGFNSLYWFGASDESRSSSCICLVIITLLCKQVYIQIIWWWLLSYFNK